MTRGMYSRSFTLLPHRVSSERPGLGLVESMQDTVFFEIENHGFPSFLKYLAETNRLSRGFVIRDSAYIYIYTYIYMYIYIYTYIYIFI